MHKRTLVLFVAFFIAIGQAPAFVSAENRTASNSNPTQAPPTDLGRLPIVFEPNAGRFDSRIAFAARVQGARLYLAEREFAFGLDGLSLLRVRFAGAAGPTRYRGATELPGRLNVFLGNDPDRWRSGVPTFAGVVAESVYPGIDVVFRSDSSALEYDFHVAPGADPSSIALDLGGATDIRIDGAGDLVAETAAGTIRQHRPIAFQEVDGERRVVPARFAFDGRSTVRFVLGQYDERHQLTIDPMVTYSSYLGGSGTDAVAGVAVDSQGNAYLVGGTDSSSFPTTAGVFQPTYSGGLADAFVTKVSATGGTILYSTYIGGNGDDAVARIVLDGSNNAYLVGGTGSTNFPTTAGAFQATFRGGTYDGFVAKLDSSGSSLLSSTYLGGGNDEGVSSIALDGAGNIYVTGATASTNFPTTSGAFDTSGGNFLGIPDAFVTKLNSTATAPVYSTYVGASFNLDGGAAIAVDSAGNAYVAGATNGGFPTTAGVVQPSSSGNFDGFVLELNAAGSALVYSTYLGGGGEDYCFGLAVGATGNAYLTGYTNSSNFPTASPIQANIAGGFDAFVTKVAPGATSLAYSTYIGGSGNEGLTSNGGLELQIAGAIAVDGAGNAYLTGFTDSTDFPTVSPFQANNGGGFDAWVAKVNTTGSALAYSSYLGGSLEERGLGIAVGADGSAYVSGLTFSSNFPTSAGAFQTTSGGGAEVTDGFITKIAGSSSVDTIGIYVGSTGSWFLRNANSSGNADSLFGFGPGGSGLVPLSGDWDGDGDDTPGLYNPVTAAFFLKNSASSGGADITVVYGPANVGFVPLVGDWDGDGDDTVGVFDPVTSSFFLRNSNTNGAADLLFGFGPANAGLEPLAGDWDGNGSDTPGLHNRATGTFFLKNSASGGPADLAFSFGPAGTPWVGLAGDWDGAGGDSIGLYDPSTGGWFLRNSNSTGNADAIFSYGPPNVTPLAGDWDGL